MTMNTSIKPWMWLRLFLLPAVTDAALARGLYLQIPTDDSAAVRWCPKTTDTNGASFDTTQSALKLQTNDATAQEWTIASITERS